MLVFLIICVVVSILMVVAGSILAITDSDFVGTSMVLIMVGVLGTVFTTIVLISFIGAGSQASFYNNLYGTAYTQIEVFFNGSFIKDYLHGTIQNINIDGLK